jgi:replicative DNA helicase Mcm
LSKLTEEDIEDFERLSGRIDENGINELTPSFAPVVIGHEYEKQALILYTANQLNRPGVDEERNKSNILFMGDPSTAKSVLAKFLQSVLIGSIKVVGGSSSAVGITGAAVKDEFLGGFMINPGALVLANDMLFLEELNTMDNEEKAKIQDAMESQFVTITKAGVSASFKVRAGIVSCANPKDGHFKYSHDKKEVIKQFDIPSPILSRFDAIFLFHDRRDRKKDFEISLSMKKRKIKTIVSEFDKDFLKKFFYYTRSRQEPEMGEDFMVLSAKVYSIIRGMNLQDKNLNARVSEAIDRMSVASAKLRGSSKVEEKDLERAMGILSHSYFATPKYSEIKEKLTEEKK